MVVEWACATLLNSQLQLFMGLKILVTGGAGYIGSHTCKALAAAGYAPVVLDNLSTGHRWAVKWGPLVVADIADRSRVKSAVKEFGIGAVIHFAAHAYVGESVRQPRKYFDNNVSKTLALLDTLLARGGHFQCCPLVILCDIWRSAESAD
jgi:UDP-arabinose 4-epimerase